MFGSTIATGCPTTSVLTFQETDREHDIQPGGWESPPQPPGRRSLWHRNDFKQTAYKTA